ncbi:HNH endonuclease signature motif containing protein [Corynebacterium suranareeae]|nr:HNH endonuclease signature motif containing protein [Corynebacterium suranareeae]
MARINAITKAGGKVPIEKRELFDAYLVDYLTPRAEAQCLPQASSIAAMMRKFIAQHCPDDSAASASEEGTIRYRRNKKGGVSITIDSTAAEGVEIKAALEQMSKDKKCTPGTSLLKIIRGLPTKVVLNTYGSKDKPEYLEGGVWLSKEQSEFWKTRTTSGHDMDAAHFAYTDAYAPTKEMRIYIKGLHRTCSVPGCCVAVENCQLDHIIPWGKGGPTTPWNIHPLCVFHHIQKTEERLKCYPLPDGTVLFLIDGIPVVSIPDGPLSRSNKTWGTKFGDYMERKIAA